MDKCDEVAHPVSHRPVYENNGDRSREQGVADLLAEKWGCSIFKMPHLCSVDRMAVDEAEVKAWLEIKCRTNSFDKYPTYMISARKIHDGLHLSRITRVPFILVVSWSDCVKYIKVEKTYPLRVGGRYDRNDALDEEIVCDIPLDGFWKHITDKGVS
jgi:hypothetical protein